MQIDNVYEHLLQGNYLGPGKTRIHIKHVAKEVARFLGIDVHQASHLTAQMILRSRGEKWYYCIGLKVPKEKKTLGEKLEEILDLHYLRQSSDIWGDIKTVIENFNTGKHGISLPVDKVNIALSLLGKRNMTIMQFISALSLNVNYMRHKSSEQSSDLVSIWKISLGRIFEYKGKTLSLRGHLIDAIYTPYNNNAEWQKNILGLLTSFSEFTEINLGSSSWVTLSRGIKGLGRDSISQDDFLLFIKSCGP